MHNIQETFDENAQDSDTSDSSTSFKLSELDPVYIQMVQTLSRAAKEATKLQIQKIEANQKTLTLGD